MEQGLFEIMLYRRTFDDDGRGAGEGLNDVHPDKSTIRLIINNPKGKTIF